MPSTYLRQRIRIRALVPAKEAPTDESNGETPSFWRNSRLAVEMAFDKDGTFVDVADYDSITLVVRATRDPTSTKHMECVVAAASLNSDLTEEQWAAGTAQNVSFEFTSDETNISADGTTKTLWMGVYALPTVAGAEPITLCAGPIIVMEDGVPDASGGPASAGSLIPEGAVYNGSGDYVLATEVGKAYRITFGANETDVDNGNENITATAIITAQGSSITLHGTPAALVTAVVSGTFYLTVAESDARYYTDRSKITQAGHGLAAKDVVRFNGTNYVKAQANSAANAEVVGIVESVAGDDFILVRNGGFIRGVTGLVAGTVYFLSAATAGLLTTTEPTTDGQVSKPVLQAITTTTGLVMNYRGVVIDSGDAGIQITDELLTGAVNGVNVTFTTAYDFRSGSTAVYIRGVRQSRGASNYSESGANGIVFSTAPATGDAPRIDYVRA